MARSSAQDDFFVAYEDGDSGWILAAERWRWDTFKAGSLRSIREDADAADDSDEDDSENEFENAVDAGESDDDKHESEWKSTAYMQCAAVIFFFLLRCLRRRFFPSFSSVQTRAGARCPCGGIQWGCLP